MKISIRKSNIKYSEQSLIEIEKYNQYRAYKKRKAYSKADRRLNKIKEW
jgi:hypothetical protein